MISKMSDGATRHSGTRRDMLQRDRLIRQKHIEVENQSLVRRLLSVKSSLDMQGFAKDYRRLAACTGDGFLGTLRILFGNSRNSGDSSYPAILPHSPS